MIRSIFIILCLTVTCSIFAQKQYATFVADTSHLRMYTGNVQGEFDRAMEMEWKIKGQTLHFGQSIKVVANNEVDTFFYKQSKRANWDTLICLIDEPKKYHFVYNDCCGGFDVCDTTNKRITGSVIFRFEGNMGSGKYIGTLGETGVFMNKSRSDTLRPTCRSAMSPNIYQVGFSLVELCNDTAEDCDQYTCVTIPGMGRDSGFRRRYPYGSFLYLPLSPEPIEVLADKMTGKLRILTWEK